MREQAKLNKKIKNIMTVSLLTSLLLATACGPKTYKFKSADFGLSYLESDRPVGDEIITLYGQTSNLITDSLPEHLLGPLVPVKTILKKKIEPKIVEVVNSPDKKEQLNLFLANYDIFFWDPVEYKKVENEESNNTFIIDVNRILRDAYKTVGGVDVSKKLLKKAKEDLEKLKEEPDEIKGFGIAVITLIIIDSSLSSYNKAKALTPELAAVVDITPENLKNEPELATEVAGKLALASIELLKLETEITTILNETSYLLKELDPQIK